MFRRKKSAAIKDPPLLKSIIHYQELFDTDTQTAMTQVQTTLDNFKRRNQKLIERQDDRTNTVQVQLISHFATLATLTLTIMGLLITQTEITLTHNQERLILVILGLEIGSILFGAIDYTQTIRFHKKWARLYQKIDREVDLRIQNGTLQWISDLNNIESKFITEAPEATKDWITYTMVCLCLTGLLCVVLLFFVYFFNFPIIK